jgi:hypothetical protein
MSTYRSVALLVAFSRAHFVAAQGFRGSFAVEPASVVTVRRTTSGWEAVVPGHSLVSARSLYTLDRRIRALTGDEPLTCQFRTGNPELDRLIQHVRSARANVRRYEEKARRFTDHVLSLSVGMPQRDVGVLVGLSHQRVYQLRVRQRELDKQLDSQGQP